MTNRIYNFDLIYNGNRVPFAIHKMEEMDEALHGEPDDPHRHNYYTLIWPFSGSGKHIIDFREYILQPDHIFFVSPEQVHQVIMESHPTGVVIQFTCSFLEKFSIREDLVSNLRLFRSSDETPPLPLTDAMKGKLKMFSDNMFESFASLGEMRYDTIGAYLKLFLIECNTHCTLYPETNPQNAEVGRNLIRTFKSQVEEHFRTRHQVKDYANLLHVTPGYLNEVIHGAIYQSAKEYIQNRLILEAKRMSLFTHKSMKEIGFELGFDDPAHFSKFFKGNTGQTLQEFKDSEILKTKS